MSSNVGRSALDLSKLLILKDILHLMINNLGLYKRNLILEWSKFKER